MAFLKMPARFYKFSHIDLFVSHELKTFFIMSMKLMMSTVIKSTTFLNGDSAYHSSIVYFSIDPMFFKFSQIERFGFHSENAALIRPTKLLIESKNG